MNYSLHSLITARHALVAGYDDLFTRKIKVGEASTNCQTGTSENVYDDLFTRKIKVGEASTNCQTGTSENMYKDYMII